MYCPNAVNRHLIQQIVYREKARRRHPWMPAAYTADNGVILWIFRLFSRMCPHPESIPLSAHVCGKGLIDERLQSLRLVLFRDGSYDGVAHDIAAAVNHIGGGISKDVGSKLSRLTI